jgi:hypothetical protein
MRLSDMTKTTRKHLYQSCEPRIYFSLYIHYPLCQLQRLIGVLFRVSHIFLVIGEIYGEKTKTNQGSS